MLKAMLERARREGVSNPKIYPHYLGLYLHEPGPLIVLPLEQVACPGRGDVKLTEGNAFIMELGGGGPLPEWGGTEVRIGREEDVVFVDGACRLIDGRYSSFYLI